MQQGFQKIYWMVLGAFLVTITSCKKFIKEELVTTLTEDYYKTDAGLEDLVKSAYAPLQWRFSGEQSYGLHNFGTDEFREGDQFNNVRYNDYDANLNANDEFVNNLWTNNYAGIRRCNQGIDLISKYDNPSSKVLGTAAQKDLRIAELQALRGLYYFQMVQQFGGVPLITSVPTEPQYEFPRASVAQVYEQIISDFKTAGPTLPWRYAGADRGRATRAMAYHFLAKAYLTRGSAVSDARGQKLTDMDSVIYFANDVIGNSGHTLESNYGNLFDAAYPDGKIPPLGENGAPPTGNKSKIDANNASNEIIFAAQFSSNLNLATSTNNQTHLFYVSAYDAGIPGMARDFFNGIAIIAENTTLDVGRCIRSGTGSLSGSSTAGFTVRGNSDLYFTPGSQLLKNFTVAGGTVNMLSNLTISGGNLPGKLNLTGGTLALASNKITIQSTSTTNTSMVTAVGAGASVTYGTGGAFVIERFIPAKRSFRFISPSVTTATSIKNNWMEGVANPDRWNNINPLPGYGTHITGPRTSADSLDVTQTYNPSLFTFNNNAQTWNAVPNSSGTLTAGSPFRFMIRGSRAVDLNDNEAVPSNTIIRTTGSLTVGTHTVGPSVLSTQVGGYSFVGNPYACPVNWLTLTKSGITNSYYTWDETLGRRGGYVVYNGTAQTNDNPASMVDENIQSSQAFFVQSTSASPSITFEEAVKSYTNTSVFRSTNAMTKMSVQLLLNLNGGNSNAADGFTAVFGNNFSKAIGDEDSYKFINLDENMAINRKGTSLSIEGRPLITDKDTIPIKIWQYRQKNYWIKINGQNFDPAITARLKDEYLKQESAVDLSLPTTIPFSITNDSASFASDRFSIVFAPNTTLTLPLTLSDVKAYQKDKGIQVEWNTVTEANIEQYEAEKSLNGSEFEKAYTTAAKADNSANHSYQWFDNNAGSGNNFYRIKIIEKTGNVRYSPVVRVNISNAISNFTVFPNPVKGNTISLQLSNMKEGQYGVNIFNTTGQMVYSSSLLHRGGSASHPILLKQKLAKGSYTLQLINNENSVMHSILVQ